MPMLYTTTTASSGTDINEFYNSLLGDFTTDTSARTATGRTFMAATAEQRVVNAASREMLDSIRLAAGMPFRSSPLKKPERKVSRFSAFAWRVKHLEKKHA